MWNTNSDDLPLWGMHPSNLFFLTLYFRVLLVFFTNVYFHYATMVGPIGFVGELHSDRNSDSKHMLFTHKNITIQYNKDQVYLFVYELVQWSMDLIVTLFLYHGFFLL